MNQVLYPLVTLVLLGTSIALARLVGRRATVAGAAALIVTLGLVWDNGVISLGNAIGEGETLRAINWPRYWIHALATPLLILFAIESAVRAGLDRAARPWARGAFWLLTAAMIAYGVFDVPAALQPSDAGGVLRYVPAGGSPTPVPAIVTNLALVGVGIALWSARGRPWLAVGSVLALVGFGLGPLGAPEVVGQVAELVLVGGILATEAGSQRRGTRLGGRVDAAGTARPADPADGTPRGRS